MMPAVLAGWLSRVAVVVCSLLSTRLLLDMLDVSDYAVYAIVLSLGPWFSLLNLGVPNAVQNLVAKNRSEGVDSADSRLAAMNAAVVAVLASALFAWPIASALRHTLLVAYPWATTASIALLSFGLCVNAFGLVFNQILFALHRGTWPNTMPGLQALLTLGLLLLAQSAQVHSLESAALAFVLPAIVVFVATGITAGAFRFQRIDAKLLISIVRQSRQFLLFSVLSTGALSADYIVMAHVLAESEIVSYNLASKVFSALLAVHAVVLSTSWTALSDLHFRRDHLALRRKVARLVLAGIGVVIPPAVAIALWHQEIFAMVGGPNVAQVPVTLLAVWLLYLVTRIWCDTFALAQLSAGQLGTMNGYVAIQTAISVSAQITLSHWWGPTGILAGITASFLFTAAWFLPTRFFQSTRR